MTADQLAIRLLMSTDPNRDKKLAKLAQRLGTVIENRAACPECENPGPHDDNGCRPGSVDFTLACCRCGTHFCP